MAMFIVNSYSDFILFVCLFVYFTLHFFTFNMNVPECTPQSVRSIFGLNKKVDSLFVYLLVSILI